MKLAVDMSCTQGKFPSGVERSFLLTLEALERMLDEPEILRLPSDRGLPSALWRGGLLPGRLARLRPLLFLSPVAALPPRAPCPMVATVHEIPERRPEAGEPSLRLLRNRRARHKLPKRAWRVLVPSERTRQALVAEQPELEERIRVFPQPLDPRFLEERGRGRPRNQRRGLVFVGVPRGRKNLPRLVEAWSRLPTSLRQGQILQLVGPPSLAKLERMGVPGLRFHPNLDTETLIDLMDRSLGLVLPSLSEGFGIPAFEAAARGIPSLCSQDSPMVEWLGDLPHQVDPYSVESIEEGLARILGDEDLWKQARIEGPRRAEAFTPERSAKAWLALLREAARL